MERTIDFMERLRSSIGGGSDYRLAKVLQVPPNTVGNYTKRGRTMDDAIAAKVAELLELDPAYVVACCHAERSTDVETTRIWERIAAQFAACFVLAAVAMPLFSGWN